MKSSRHRPAIWRPRGYFSPENDYHDGQATADVVFEEAPREPQVIETGLLDARGVPLVRVIVPIMLPRAGFHLPPDRPPVEDEVHFLVPADEVAVVTDMPGLGLSHFHPSEVDDEESDQ